MEHSYPVADFQDKTLRIKQLDNGGYTVSGSIKKTVKKGDYPWQEMTYGYDDTPSLMEGLKTILSGRKKEREHDIMSTHKGEE